MSSDSGRTDNPPDMSRRNFVKISAADASGPLGAGLTIERAADSAMCRTANRFKSVLTVAVLVALAASLAGESRGDENISLFVATNGNDAWSGRRPAPNASQSDGPFATLQRACDAIRQLKRGGPLPKGGVVVELAGGIYQLAQPLQLAPQDSGTEEAPIVYRGTQGSGRSSRRRHARDRLAAGHRSGGAGTT